MGSVAVFPSLFPSRVRVLFLFVLLFAGGCQPGGGADPAAVFAPDNNSGVDNSTAGDADKSTGDYPSKGSVLQGQSREFHISNG